MTSPVPGVQPSPAIPSDIASDVLGGGFRTDTGNYLNRRHIAHLSPVPSTNAMPVDVQLLAATAKVQLRDGSVPVHAGGAYHFTHVYSDVQPAPDASQWLHPPRQRRPVPWGAGPGLQKHHTSERAVGLPDPPVGVPVRPRYEVITYDVVRASYPTSELLPPLTPVAQEHTAPPAVRPAESPPSSTHPTHSSAPATEGACEQSSRADTAHMDTDFSFHSPASTVQASTCETPSASPQQPTAPLVAPHTTSPTLPVQPSTPASSPPPPAPVSLITQSATAVMQPPQQAAQSTAVMPTGLPASTIRDPTGPSMHCGPIIPAPLMERAGGHTGAVRHLEQRGREVQSSMKGSWPHAYPPGSRLDRGGKGVWVPSTPQYVYCATARTRATVETGPDCQDATARVPVAGTGSVHAVQPVENTPPTVTTGKSNNGLHLWEAATPLEEDPQYVRHGHRHAAKQELPAPATHQIHTILGKTRPPPPSSTTGSQVDLTTRDLSRLRHDKHGLTQDIRLQRTAARGLRADNRRLSQHVQAAQHTVDLLSQGYGSPEAVAMMAQGLQSGAHWHSQHSQAMSGPVLADRVYRDATQDTLDYTVDKNTRGAALASSLLRLLAAVQDHPGEFRAPAPEYSTAGGEGGGCLASPDPELLSRTRADQIPWTEVELLRARLAGVKEKLAAEQKASPAPPAQPQPAATDSLATTQPPTQATAATREPVQGGTAATSSIPQDVLVVPYSQLPYPDRLDRSLEQLLRPPRAGPVAAVYTKAQRPLPQFEGVPQRTQLRLAWGPRAQGVQRSKVLRDAEDTLAEQQAEEQKYHQAMQDGAAEGFTDDEVAAQAQAAAAEEEKAVQLSAERAARDRAEAAQEAAARSAARTQSERRREDVQLSREFQDSAAADRRASCSSGSDEEQATADTRQPTSNLSKRPSPAHQAHITATDPASTGASAPPVVPVPSSTTQPPEHPVEESDVYGSYTGMRGAWDSQGSATFRNLAYTRTVRDRMLRLELVSQQLKGQGLRDVVPEAWALAEKQLAEHACILENIIDDEREQVAAAEAAAQYRAEEESEEAALKAAAMAKARAKAASEAAALSEDLDDTSHATASSKQHPAQLRTETDLDD